MASTRHSRPLHRRLLAVAATAALSLGGVLGGPAGPAAAEDLLVTVPGSFDSELGCPSDWQPDCTDTQLSPRASDGVYTGTFTIPSGDYEYKIAVGGSWDENYGLGGVPGGGNATLSLTEDTAVTFYYDAVSHWFTTSADGPVITAAGSFQSELGCPADWSPDCLKSWLQDPDGDGTYTLTTAALPTGNYETKVTHNLSWDENYGLDGVPGGDNIAFSASQGKSVTFSYVLATHVLTITTEDPPLAGAGQLRAFWVDQDTLAWPTNLLLPSGATPTDLTWQLHYSPTAGISAVDGGVVGGGAVDLTYDPAGLSSEQLTAHPELTGYLALRPTGLDRGTIEQILQDQILVSARFQTEDLDDPDGELVALTGVQLPGVLDSLFAADASERVLGVSWSGDIPTITVWAPTAQDVQVKLGGSTTGTAPADLTVPATRNADGTWSATGDPSWYGVRYRFEVTVYAPAAGQIVVNDVTDPYSAALTVDSEWSVAIDLADPTFRPTEWADTASPIVARPIDHSIYELHIRDFSISDTTVPAEARGKYAAFTYDSAGTRHLQQLAAAGLNTVHLLPSFDIASIPETGQVEPDCDLASFAPDSTEQQACVAATAAGDGYNWGYDPLHFNAPDGSYAMDPDGGARVAEFRSMVGALHADGLQVVLDQVFNHTAASGQDPKSVLDQVVPGYYQRLNPLGAVYTSTCCQDVATEHAMGEKLMVDSVVQWAKEYKVDGFRFDLMGFHSRENMEAIRAGLDALTMATDGVDGSAVYLYGEGWNFGEVQNNALFYQASQGQLGGTSIATFNDRMRDGVNGGSPVSSSSFRDQGFGNGLATDPNGVTAIPDEDAALAQATDWVKLGLTGNLRSYTFVTSDGTVKNGGQIDYNGQPAGYADQPDEVINYVDAHDNFTLFDGLTIKLPVDTAMPDRVRMNTLSLATATLSQGVSFWHAGADLLRSKSLDHNSYDSGDWFNYVDWTGQDNGFGRGLPRAADNSEQWVFDGPLLANPALTPSPADIAAASVGADTLLALRYSSPLFRLGSADLINQKLTFPNSGTDATQGVIVMRIDDTVGVDVDPALDGLVVVFNASPDATTQTVAELAGSNLQLSDLQAGGADAVVKATTFDPATGAITVPARTVAVLVQPTAAATSSVALDASAGGTQIYGSNHPVTLTATIDSTGGEVGGTVDFVSGETVLGTAVAQPTASGASSGSATLVLSSTLPAGAYPVVARWSGTDTAPAAESAPLTVTVKPATSSTGLVAIGLGFGRPVLVAVTGLNNGQSASGRMVFRDGDTIIGTAVVRYGLAVIRPSAGPGLHTYTATFVPSQTGNVTGGVSNTVRIRR